MIDPSSIPIFMPKCASLAVYRNGPCGSIIDVARIYGGHLNDEGTEVHGVSAGEGVDG